MSRSAIEALLDADCPGYEKLVLLVIARHGRGTNGSGGYPSVRRIARISGISTSTAYFALDSLTAKHWLTRSSGAGRGANKYEINLDAIPMLPDLWATHRSVSAVETQEASLSVLTVDTQESVVYRGGVRSVSTVDNEASTEASTSTHTPQNHALTDDDPRPPLPTVSSKAKTALPDWIPEESWDGFVEMRKKIKFPLTDHAQKSAIAKLEKFRAQGYSPELILDAATFNCWRGLFIPKGEDGQPIKPDLQLYRDGTWDEYNAERGLHFDPQRLCWLDKNGVEQ